jgi:RNA polymerase sigma-70 factor (ECF subfamily)
VPDPLEQHLKTVYRFALRLAGGDAHVAEDLTQEAMLRAWRDRGKLHDEQAARTWLFRVTANLWRDQIRHASVRRRTWWRRDAAAARDLPAARPREDDREEFAQILRALDALPDRQRQVLYLSACEGLAVEHVAEVLQIAAGAVRSSLSLARQRLRAELEKHDPAPEAAP